LKRLLTKRLLAAGLVIAGLAAFAGTCTIQRISLTTIGSNDVFAGEIHNDSGVGILQHNMAVAFLDGSNNLLETQIVQPCLRTLPSGGANYFSATSNYPAVQTQTGLARINLDSTFKVGPPATGSGTITGLTVTRNGTSLLVNGTFKNLDSTTLTEPNACAVVYNSSGNVVVVKLDQTMVDLAQNASDTFPMTITVPDSTTTVSRVDIYVDGLRNNVPILPITATGNAIVVGTQTPVATATSTATPGAAVKLGFVTTLGTATRATSFGGVQVAIQDANGLTVTGSTASVTLSIDSGTGSGGAALTCPTSTLMISAVNGVATFTPCQINLGGVGYVLKAVSGGLSTAFSNSFNVTPGAATGLAWVQQPAAASSFTSGAAWTAGSQPILKLVDSDGVVVWNDNSTTVTLSLGTNPGGGVLTCTTSNSRVVSGGIATFSGCSSSKVGSEALAAVDGLLNAPAGNAFNIMPVIVFTTAPSSSPASGVNFAQQPIITLRNGDGTTVTGDSTTAITLTLSAAISGGPGVLACTTNPMTAASGIVTFAGCKITGAGTYTITASGTNLTSVTTGNIVVSP
jgi:hypothetical protein